MFRISRRDGDVTDGPFVEQVEPAIRSSPTGRYHIDEISADTLPSSHTSRRWGVGIMRDVGSVMIEPYPWAD
jgi:hypothetical protein